MRQKAKDRRIGLERESATLVRIDRTQEVRRGVLLVLVSAAAFGALPIFAKLAYREDVNLKTLLALRFTFAALIMWVLWAFERRKVVSTQPANTLAKIIPLVIMGALLYVGQSFSYFTAVGIISATATSLLLYTYPTLVTILSWLLFKEHMSWQKLGALLIAAIGTIMVLGIVSSLISGGTGALGEVRPEGIAWALIAAVVYSAYIITGARYTSVQSPIFSSAVIITSAAVVYTLWGAISGELDLGVSALGLLWALGLALVSTVVAITTFFGGLRLVGPSRASIISTLEPAVTVALAAAVLNEAITFEQLCGGVLILAAVVLLQLNLDGNRGKEA